jgi:hypothetical protein
MYPALSAASEGYEVYAVIDPSGCWSNKTEELAVRRLVMGGVHPMNWEAVARELQVKAWTEDQGPQVMDVFTHHNARSSCSTPFTTEQSNACGAESADIYRPARLPIHYPNPRDVPVNAGKPSLARGARKPSVCRDIRVESAPHVLLAMQKAESSNPFSRSPKTPLPHGFRPRWRGPRPRFAAFSRSGPQSVVERPVR